MKSIISYTNRHLNLSLALLCTLLSPAQSGANSESAQPATSSSRTKLIHAGWERPDSSDMVRYIREMEDTPYDGIILMIRGRNDQGERVLLQNAFNKTPWKREWFERNVRELQSVQSSSLTDNFVRISANPGNVDWFDDEGWAIIADHMRIAAWIAKEGGLKGICFDPEPYSKPHFQMSYRAQEHSDRYSFEEYQAKARQRGREIMEAIKDEYPDIVFFTFFMNSQNMNRTPETLIGSGYNLYPAFIDGWLDVAPPEMTFIDGNENSYHYSGELDYLRASNGMRNTVLQLVAPENHAKHRSQVRTGFALYLDAYANPEGHTWYHGPLHGSRTTQLLANAGFAADIADEYVWTWGEKYRWWPTGTTNVNPESWDEVIPGSYNALLSAFNPQRLIHALQEEFARQERRGSQKNLVRNGDFASHAIRDNQAPKAWDPWKNRRVKEEATITLDPTTDRRGKKDSGSARLAGINVRGSLAQTFGVVGGQYYQIRGWMKSTGAGGNTILVRWKNEQDEWVDMQKDVRLQPVGEPAADGEWQQMQAIAIVPGDATTMMLLLSATNQLSATEDIVWFDDLEVIPLAD